MNSAIFIALTSYSSLIKLLALDQGCNSVCLRIQVVVSPSRGLSCIQLYDAGDVNLNRQGLEERAYYYLVGAARALSASRNAIID